MKAFRSSRFVGPRGRKMGGAGDSPAPVGDPPTGTETAIGFGRNGLSTMPLRSVPSGGSPDGTGESPVLPLKSAIGNWQSAMGFTLIELLVVISIMTLIAALAVPALKNLGKSNIQAGAMRQMLDDVGRARQLAISEHTTVYMIFVRTNFWMTPGWPNTWWKNPVMTPAQLATHQAVATNLCDKQLTGYTFVSLRSAGDQPGQGKCRYLASWQSLPEGAFIAQQKFQLSANFYFNLPSSRTTYQIYGFNTTNTIPFPTQDSASGAASGILSPDFDLPYIAFNYLGQLTFDGLNMAWRDEYIPMAQGTVSPAIDVATKTPVIYAGSSPQINETPPGNSTNSMFHIIHIDRLTGRATLEYQRVQ